MSEGQVLGRIEFGRDVLSRGASVRARAYEPQRIAVMTANASTPPATGRVGRQALDASSCAICSGLMAFVPHAHASVDDRTMPRLGEFVGE